MTEQDTGIKVIKSIAYGNASRCEIHAVKNDGHLLCGIQLGDSPIHAGYDISQVTCQRCVKKLREMPRMDECDGDYDEDSDDEESDDDIIPMIGGLGGGLGGGFGGGSTGGGGAGR
jgi:hypothetical protein